MRHIEALLSHADRTVRETAVDALVQVRLLWDVLRYKREVDNALDD